MKKHIPAATPVARNGGIYPLKRQPQDTRTGLTRAEQEIRLERITPDIGASR